MSMRSVVEFNHDCIEKLKDDGHISPALFAWLCEAHRHKENERFPIAQGVRYLALRHHTETMELKVE